MTQKQQHELWSEIANQYSRRHLTDLEDRLKAIAGVANELSQLWGDSFMFGLWKNYLVQQLLWEPLLPVAAARQQRRSPRAPSWSWASLDIGMFFARNFTAIAEDCDQQGSDWKITIKCRAHTAEEIRPGTRKKIDVVEDDSLGGEGTYFLLAGRKMKHDAEVWALIGIPLGLGEFRRIGCSRLPRSRVSHILDAEETTAKFV